MDSILSCMTACLLYTSLSERRIAIIKEYDFYNQRYCGCEFSMRKEDAAPAADGDN